MSKNRDRAGSSDGIAGLAGMLGARNRKATPEITREQPAQMHHLQPPGLDQSSSCKSGEGPVVVQLPTIVWIAGTSWDGVPGTDRRLVSELSALFRVIWVDPPRRIHLRQFRKEIFTGFKEVSPGITRIEVPAPPGMTRPVVRRVTAVLLNRAIHRAVQTLGAEPSALVVAFPIARFPKSIRGVRVLYVTDDWLAGATLMGFSVKHIKSAMISNIKTAAAVVAVSPAILDTMSSIGTMDKQAVLPNGCPTSLPDSAIRRERIIGLVGQLNERLDIDVLEALQRTGERILVIGPRTDQDKPFGQRLTAFLEAKNVEWLGPVSPDQLPSYLSCMSLGITPYANTQFNRSSFPLKTLEYLSAGLPVIATDSPAVQWLNSEHIKVAFKPTEFVAEVCSRLDQGSTISEEQDRRQFADQHSWPQRSKDFAELLAQLNEQSAPVCSTARERTSDARI